MPPSTLRYSSIVGVLLVASITYVNLLIRSDLANEGEGAYVNVNVNVIGMKYQNAKASSSYEGIKIDIASPQNDDFSDVHSQTTATNIPMITKQQQRQQQQRDRPLQNPNDVTVQADDTRTQVASPQHPNDVIEIVSHTKAAPIDVGTKIAQDAHSRTGMNTNTNTNTNDAPQDEKNTVLWPDDAIIQAAVQPLWSCGRDRDDVSMNRNAKFIFVHIFKTAGSTLRSLLWEYAQKCKKGNGLIVSCTGVKTSSMVLPDQVWKNCALKCALNRKGEYHRSGTVNNLFLGSDDLDIIGGHWRLGTADHLRNKNDAPLQLRHVAFFRDAAAKFVSGVVYTKRQQQGHRYTNLDLYKMIKKEVTSLLRHGKYHEKYWNYLLTPSQVKTVKPQNLTRTEINNLMKQNMVDYNLTIGIVDRMPESMDVLRHILDSDGTAAELFHQYGGRNNGDNDKNNMNVTVNPNPNTKKNQSGSSKLLQMLQDDVTFYAKLLEYVKYEQGITEFAMQLHQRQYQAILQKAT